MKIAVISSFPPFRGGIAQFNESLALAIRSAGHDCKGYSFSRQYPELLFPGTQQYEPGAVSAVTISASIDSIRPSTWFRAAHDVADWGADLVVVPFWTAFLAPCLAVISKQIKRRSKRTIIIGLFHNANSHDAHWFEKHLTRQLLRNTDAAWTLSADVSNGLLRHGYQRRITTAFHPLYHHFAPLVDADSTKQKLGIPLHGKVILFFGLIRPYKGLDVLIKAANALLTKGIDLNICIAGEPYENWAPYQELIDSGNHADRFHSYLKFIPQEEVHEFFSAADLVCLPYKSASQSGVTAIAMQYHLPVLATDVGGLNEYFKGNPLGHLCEPDSPASLAHGILSALETPPPNEQDINAWNERFSWASFVQKCLS